MVPSTPAPGASSSHWNARSGLARYLVALGSLAVSLLVRYALRDALGQTAPYLQFFPALIIAAWYGGLGPGLLTTGIATLTAMYFLLPPAGFAVGEAHEVASLLIFAATGVVISWLNHRLRLSQNAQRMAAATAIARAERLDAILKTTADGIIVIDAKGNIESFNPGAERLFEYPQSEVIGRNVSVLMPSPHREEHDQYLTRYLTTGEARIIGTGRAVIGRRRNGTLFPVQLAVGEMRIGGELKFTGLLHDLTSRVRLDERLQASEARWRAVIESAVDGIVVIDAHGGIEAFNPGAERLFGYSEQDVIGRHVDMLLQPASHAARNTPIAHYPWTGSAEVPWTGREVQGFRKDGTTFPLQLSVGQIATAAEPKFTGILHDLSARVHMEEQLREQATLVKLGEMAAVIAHEVKNPLAGIRGAIQVIGTRLPRDSSSASILKEIVARIDSLDQMIKDLLVFARPPKLRCQPTDVVPLISATADLLCRDPVWRDIQIEVEGSAPPVSADAEMLKIVFQNLLINSAHAMHGKGTMRVAVNSFDGTCRIAFIDSGPGIPADVRPKIFVPFFTTKARGSGLGLPTAKRLIEEHGGAITVDCPPTGGTTVIVRLPLMPD